MPVADSPLGGAMIFNVGAPRSGTFWLQRIVCAHPRVAAVPSETHLFSHGIAPLTTRFQQRELMAPDVGLVYFEHDRAIAAVRQICDQVFLQFRTPGTERVAERTPVHAEHLELIAEVYPEARFVHIIRDGRDVARSMAVQDWGPGDIAGAAERWRDVVQAARAAGLPHELYLEVRYEALLGNPAREIAAIYDFLDLDADPETLERATTEAGRQENVDRFGIGGVATEKWKSALKPAELAAFMDVAGDLLGELGYRTDDPQPQRGLRAAASKLLGG